MTKYCIKFVLLFLTCVAISSCNNIGSTGSTSSAQNVSSQNIYQLETWKYVGDKNFISSNTLPSITNSPVNNKLYIAYDNNVSDIHVMKYETGSWRELGFAASIAHGKYPKITFNQTDEQPFVLFNSINDNKLSVMTYNGSSWVFVGNPEFSLHGSNKLSSSIAMDRNNNLYVAYNGIDDRKAHVMTYNKMSNSWKEVGDIQDTSGLSLKLAINPKNNHPYILTETTTAVPIVKEFDGTKWNNVGEIPTTDKSIPYSLDLAFDPINGVPNIVYQSTNSKGIVVLAYNGMSWNYLGDKRVNENSYINNISLAINNAGKPYIMFSDIKYDGKLSAISYDGKQWKNIGAPGFSTQSNLQTSFVIIGNDKKTTLYAVVQDSNGVSVMSNEEIPAQTISWYQSNITDKKFYDVRYGGGVWVAGSYLDTGLLWSLDGKVWNQSNMATGRFFNVNYSNGVWVATTTSVYDEEIQGVFWSNDGKIWHPSNIFRDEWSSYYANGLWITGGVLASSNMKLHESKDIKARKQIDNNSSTETNLRIVPDNGLGGISWSSDGKDWKQSNIISGSFYTAHYANSLWVAGTAGSIYWSNNGKEWNSTTLDCYCSIIDYANGIWVVGDRVSGVYWSQDGKHWEKGNIPPIRGIYGLDYANGTWVAVGNAGIFWSQDGKNWNKSNLDTSSVVLSVHYANGIWIAGVNGSNGIYWSYDGKTWTKSNESTGYIDSLFYANNTWVGVGYRIFYGLENY